MDPIMDGYDYYRMTSMKARQPGPTCIRQPSFEAEYRTYVISKAYQAWKEGIITVGEYNRLVDMLTSEDVENVRVAEEILRLEVQKFNQKIVSHEKTIQPDLSEEGPTQEV